MLRDIETDADSELAVTGVFVAIGHDPNTKLFTGQLDLDADGYIVTEPGIDANVGRRRVRRRRRAGPHLPAGDHRRRLRAAWRRSRPSATSKRSATSAG